MAGPISSSHLSLCKTLFYIHKNIENLKHCCTHAAQPSQNSFEAHQIPQFVLSHSPTQWELPELLGYKQGARRACTPLAPVVPLSHRTLENASFGVLWGPGQGLQSLRPSLAENNNINDTKKKKRKASETL